MITRPASPKVEGRVGVRLDLSARARQQEVRPAAKVQNGEVLSLADRAKPSAGEESRGSGDVAHLQEHMPD